MKMAALWVVASCWVVRVHQCFGGPYWIHHQGDAGRTKGVGNVSKLIPFCMALQPRTRPSSHRRQNVKSYLMKFYFLGLFQNLHGQVFEKYQGALCLVLTGT
jgi:hypothetical protein